jgi:hypothetical protein
MRDWLGEAQGDVILFQFEAESFDDEVVIFALGQAGDRDAADDAGAGDVDREAAAVSGVVGVGQVVAFAEGAVGLLEPEADGVGAAVEAGDYIRFALNPAGIVWSGASEGGVEEWLVWLAEAADIDDEGLVAGERQFAEALAETPGGVVVEAGEAKFCFLTSDGGEVFCDGHFWIFLVGLKSGIRTLIDRVWSLQNGARPRRSLVRDASEADIAMTQISGRRLSVGNP